jgi:tetratricopeptide (TPR) repeat protein
MHSNNLLTSLSNQSEETFLERNADAINRITIFADFSEGFTIGFAEVNLERDRNLTIEALQSKSSDIQWIPIYLNHRDLRYLIAETTKALESVEFLTDRKPVLLICGLENAIGGYGDYPDVLSNINIARDSYTHKLPYPMLFLLPNYAINRFAKFAPDFYAWKSMEVRLQSEIPKSENLDSELTLIPEHQRVIPVPPARFDFLYHLLEQYRQPSLGRADLLDQLGDAYVSHVKYAEAEPAYCEALKLYKDFQNPLNEARVLNNLAKLYYFQGRYSEVEPLYLRSLQIREHKLGADSRNTAQSLNNLVGLYLVQGNYIEAEPLFLRSLSIWERQLGADHPHVATSLNNLSELYRVQGKYSEAELLRLRCLEIERKALGEKHPQFAASLNNLALLYKSQGRYSEAEPGASQFCNE